MSTTTTPNLGLIKPTPGTREPIRVADLNTNADLIDAWVTNPDVKGSLRLRGDVYDANGKLLFQLTPPQAAAANYFQFIGGAPGNGGSFALQGADAKGKLIIGVRGQTTDAEATAETGAQIDLTGNIEGGLNNILQLVPGYDGTNQGINFIRIQSSSTGIAVRVLAVGADTNINLKLGTQALGTITLAANMGNNKILRLISVLSALEGADLNSVKITNALTGTGPTLATEGVDTNVDLLVSPKGNGAVSLTCPIKVGVFNSVFGGTISLGAAFVSRGTTNPSNAINLFNGTAPVGTLANGVTLYASGGKLFAMDAAGVATQLTP